MLISQLAHCIDFHRLCEWVCALWLSLYPVTVVAVWRSCFLYAAIWNRPFHPSVCRKDILHNNHFELQLNTCTPFCFNNASCCAVFCWSDSILRASCQLCYIIFLMTLLYLLCSYNYVCSAQCVPYIKCWASLSYDQIDTLVALMSLTVNIFQIWWLFSTHATEA